LALVAGTGQVVQGSLQRLLVRLEAARGHRKGKSRGHNRKMRDTASTKGTRRTRTPKHAQRSLALLTM
jgi:hypothetical protein